MRTAFRVLVTLCLALVASSPLAAQVRAPKRTLTRTVAAPTSGQYRIVIVGFRVDQETVDDMLERDGKRDEVYVAAGVQHFDRRDGRMIAQGVARSSIMGDQNGFPARVRAGSASPQGGIRTSDNVPAVADVGSYLAAPTPSGLPLLVWEGQLQDGVDAVVVESDVWEWDGQPDLYNRWVQTAAWPTIGDKEVVDLIASQSLGPTPQLAGTAWRGLGRHSAGMDRPVGVIMNSGNATWNINALVVTREAVERAFQAGASVGGRPPATVEILRRGSSDSGTDGSYRIFLRVERVP